MLKGLIMGIIGIIVAIIGAIIWVILRAWLEEVLSGSWLVYLIWMCSALVVVLVVVSRYPLDFGGAVAKWQAPPAIHKLGEENILVRGPEVKVVSAKPVGTTIDVEVEFHNSSEKTSSEPPYGSFDARDSEGNCLSALVPETQGAWLNEKIPPKSSMKGTLSYALQGSDTGIKLHYSPHVSRTGLLPRSLREGSVVFALDDVALKNPWPRPAGMDSAKPFVSGTTYAVGDAVNVRGVIVKLVSARLSGNSLSVKVLMYNDSFKYVFIVDVSGFEIKDPYGRLGTHDSSAESPDATAPHGRLWSGDTIGGTMFYEFPSTTRQAKLYYTNSALGGDTVIFAVK